MKNLNQTSCRGEAPCFTRQSISRVGNHGFTLVEILVALAVLAVLGAMIVQMISGTGRTTRLSNQLVDAASQARLAFDCIGQDLGTLVKRTDTDFEVGQRNSADDAGFAAGQAATGGDALLFLSELASQGGDRNLSLVAYRLAQHPDNRDASGQSRVCLLRAGVPIFWSRPQTWGNTSFMGLRNDGLPVQLSGSDSSFASALLPVITNFDVLAPGVLQTVVGFQLYPDNQPVTCKDGTTIQNALGQIVYSPPVRPSPMAGYIDLSRISAIVVGLVVIDADSLKRLNAGDADLLSAKFTTPNAGTMPVASWTKVIYNLITSPTAPGLLPVRQALRAYQRVYPINPYGKHSL